MMGTRSKELKVSYCKFYTAFIIADSRIISFSSWSISERFGKLLVLFGIQKSRLVGTWFWFDLKASVLLEVLFVVFFLVSTSYACKHVN